MGFARVVSDGHTVSYLADVYVLEEFRAAASASSSSGSPSTAARSAQTKWLLHTRDMHRLYAKLGFAAPDERAMERWPAR